MKISSLSPSEYEAFVSNLVEELSFAKSGVVKKNDRIQGVRQPGIYEIDISVRVPLSDVLSFLLIVECKNWSRPVGREVVQKLAQTRDAVSADKAALVSPVGFTKEALEVARVLEIALWVVTLDEWVVQYDTGHAHLYLDWLKEDRDRNWNEHPAMVRVSEWGRHLAMFPASAELPHNLAWGRFCQLGFFNSYNVINNLQREIQQRMFHEKASNSRHERLQRRSRAKWENGGSQISLPNDWF